MAAERHPADHGHAMYHGSFNPIKPIVGAVKSAAEGVKDAGEWAMRHGPIQDPKQTQMPRPPKKRK